MANTSQGDGALQRGRACLSCRRRKMRCDGARPFCTQCIRGGRQEDCEYTDNQGRTRTQVLEENVARLQARIQELENPDTTAPPVLLHDPYGTGGAGSVPAAMAWWEFEEPPAHISNLLIKEFISRAPRLGFALNIPRFLASLNLPTLHPLRPHAALLHVIYLWSVHLSSNSELVQHEHVFLQRAVLALQDAIGSGTANDATIAQKRLHAMQAEVLLAIYFFCLGRYLEGRYHANAAVSLAVSCGLHRIKPELLFSAPAQAVPGSLSAFTNFAALGAIGELGLFDLAAPADVIELGERINAFWAVFCVDKCWSTAVGSPSFLVDDATSGTRIETPWPLNSEDYEMLGADVIASMFPPSGQTVQRFLSGQTSLDDVIGSSYPALRVKASALYERAARVASVVSAAGPNAQGETLDLARLITNFARSLVPLDNITSQVENVNHQQDLLVIHSLAHSAMIRLYSVRASAAPGGDLRDINVCLIHAGEILRVMEFLLNQDHSSDMVDPILGALWMTAAQIFVQELARARATAGQDASSRARVEALERNVDRLSAALSNAVVRPILGMPLPSFI
ncbi:hypothetical protein SCHPADRAFT_870268 [Schizopora paradoxa]|uniref:Zn(2)-C6 fungal-type domain-containing protein n=1 Tax=Schizopora paradoxa TaxID=27342 RepID=A0A0H2S2U5_9AGAM|nr:hypothetical protein SCHPADRAFT_870268 [Schizopora paradoxa]